MYIISMVLTCMKIYAEAYLELSQTSMVELLCENYEKALLYEIIRKCSTGF